MKFIGFLVKVAVAFLAFGAVASLYLSEKKENYVAFDLKDNSH